jgi:hypothetical protein
VISKDHSSAGDMHIFKGSWALKRATHDIVEEHRLHSSKRSKPRSISVIICFAKGAEEVSFERRSDFANVDYR